MNSPFELLSARAFFLAMDRIVVSPLGVVAVAVVREIRGGPTPGIDQPQLVDMTLLPENKGGRLVHSRPEGPETSALLPPYKSFPRNHLGDKTKKGGRRNAVPPED